MDASDSSNSSDDENFDPNTIIERNFEAEMHLIVKNLLPNKSRAQYETAYAKLLKYIHDNKAPINENVLVVYFKELSIKWKPSTCWSHWSKLRATLSLRHNININEYHLLKSLLKDHAKGYKAKKSLTLSWTQIRNFLQNSDDYLYLATKVFIHSFTDNKLFAMYVTFVYCVYIYILGYSYFRDLWSYEMCRVYEYQHQRCRGYYKC